MDRRADPQALNRNRSYSGGRTPSERSVQRAESHRSYPTRIEKRLSDILNGLHLSFLREYWIGGHWVDFALRDYFVVIEADGRLYHNDPDRELARDAEIQAFGWQVLHIYGPNIINEPKLVEQAIKQAVRSARVRPRPPGALQFRDARLEWDRPRPPSRPRRPRYRHRE